MCRDSRVSREAAGRSWTASCFGARSVLHATSCCALLRSLPSSPQPWPLHPHTLPAGPEWGCCHSLVADAVAPARQVQCGNGVKEAGSQATQASVPQGWSHRARERGRNRQARVRNR